MEKPKKLVKTKFMALLPAALFLFASCKSENAGYQLKPEEFDVYSKDRKAIYLNGSWKLLKLPNTENNPVNDPGTRNGFYKADYKPDNKWANVSVPWCWNIDYNKWKQGKNNSAISFGDNKCYTSFSGVGWYWKSFKIPKDFSDKRLILHFDYADNLATVYLNGEKIGKHANLRDNYYMHLDESFELDVTKAAKPGAENMLAVRIYDDGDPELERSRKYGAPGGIRGVVWLEAKPEIYVKKAYINPHISPRGINVDFILENPSKKSKNLSIEISATPLDKVKKAESYNLKLEINAKSGESKHSFYLPMKNAKLWSIWSPALYLLRIKSIDAGNKDIMYSQRFGLREFVAKGRNFFLNGKKVFWIGVTFNAASRVANRFSSQRYNHENRLKTMLSAYKAMNINRIRVHGNKYPSILYDLCDELGIMVTDEYMGPDSKDLRADQVKDVAEIVSYNESSLTETRKKELLSQIESVYNHPSVVTWSCGNERHDKPGFPIRDILASEYRFYKKTDKQNRPVCASGGRFMDREKSLTDYFDDHAYHGSGYAGKCMTTVPENISKYFRNVKKLYGKEANIPYVNGEGFYYNFRHGKTLNALRPVFPDGQLELEKYLELLVKNPSPTMKQFGRPLVNRIGIRQYADEKKYQQWVARYVQRYIEMFRRLQEKNVSGVEMLQDYFCQTVPPENLSMEYFTDRPEFNAIKNASSPVLACFDFFNQNAFAGKEFSSEIWIMNNSPECLNKTKLTIQAFDEKNNVFDMQKNNLPDIPQGKIIKLPYKLNLRSDLPTGFYKIKLSLKDKEEKVLSSNEYEIFVLGEKDAHEKISTNNSIALYDKSGKLGKILTETGVSYAKIRNFNDLSKYDVIFIGPYSIDENVLKAHLSDFVKSGGKLAVFEQNPVERLPWLPGAKIQKVWPDTFVDILFPDHPVFEKLNQKNWDIWSWPKQKPQNYGRIFDAYITPVDNSILAAGAKQDWTWRGNEIGSVIVDALRGKGRVFMSQAQAFSRYNQDSAARRYVLNVLKYILDNKPEKKK